MFLTNLIDSRNIEPSHVVDAFYAGFCLFWTASSSKTCLDSVPTVCDALDSFKKIFDGLLLGEKSNILLADSSMKKLDVEIARLELSKRENIARGSELGDINQQLQSLMRQRNIQIEQMASSNRVMKELFTQLSAIRRVLGCVHVLIKACRLPLFWFQ